MPESTLSLTYYDFKAEVATYLGWGRGSDNGDTAWTTLQEAELDYIVRSGLRQVYFPPAEAGVSHQWSFLKPQGSVTVESGQRAVALPDDFGGFDGRLVFDGDEAREPVPFVALTTLEEFYGREPSRTGAPLAAAEVSVRGTAGNAGQRRELKVFPEPDASYTLNFRYYVIPDHLNAAKPYHYGGAMHTETFLESCLAIAEQRKDGVMGLHTAKFRERLATSIAIDARSKAQLLGYNGDRSDGVYRRTYRQSRFTGTVTLNDVTPT
ncbi:MAG TPA: hypothetical protein VM529_24950 [Gemmata sp.]|jgi:hypothetical protein|nr:hypothetical protein [Gemmata sp.]